MYNKWYISLSSGMQSLSLVFVDDNSKYFKIDRSWLRGLGAARGPFISRLQRWICCAAGVENSQLRGMNKSNLLKAPSSPCSAPPESRSPGQPTQRPSGCGDARHCRLCAHPLWSSWLSMKKRMEFSASLSSVLYATCSLQRSFQAF